MDVGLKDRRVLVTGGSQGIGYAIIPVSCDQAPQIDLHRL